MKGKFLMGENTHCRFPAHSERYWAVWQTGQQRSERALNHKGDKITNNFSFARGQNCGKSVEKSVTNCGKNGEKSVKKFGEKNRWKISVKKIGK